MSYTGRFAPSPSGPLHYGSIVTALASYIDAKSHAGRWLIRIEDIDPPRECAGAKSLILDQLAAFGLVSDGPVIFQSEQIERYQNQIESWSAQGLAYYCDCTRKRLKQLSHIYDGHCLSKTKVSQPAAIRFHNTFSETQFTDRVFGQVTLPQAHAQQDFIIRRKDGLIAYQIAVVMDDIKQNISHIVRGSDLLDSTLWQHSLYRTLEHSPPSFAHIPVILGPDGRKLSKQNGAPAILLNEAQTICFSALQTLMLAPPAELQLESVSTQLDWAVAKWQINTLSNTP